MLEMFKGVANSPETTITNDIDNSDTIIYVLDETRIPEDLPNLMVLGTGTSAETIKVLSIEGNAITVERGFQGVPRSWNAGTIIARNFTEYDYNALVENVKTLKGNTDTNAGDILSLMNYVGNLENLDTVEKSNIVLALNEIYQDLIAHKAETIHQGKHSTLEATSTSDATSVANAPLKSAGGLAVAKKGFFGDSVITPKLTLGGMKKYIQSATSSTLINNTTDTTLAKITFLYGSWTVVLLKITVLGNYGNAFLGTQEIVLFRGASDIAPIMEGESTTIYKINNNLSISYETTNAQIIINAKTSLSSSIPVWCEIEATAVTGSINSGEIDIEIL